jgi:chaperonin GroES
MITLPKDKVFVIAIGDPEKIGALYIPDTAKERSDQGIVKYVGPDVKDIKPGDYVVFAGWTGTAIHIEGGIGIILPEDQCQCVLHPPATEVAGSYHLDSNGNPFPATYESSVQLLRDQYWSLPRFANLRNRRS